MKAIRLHQVGGSELLRSEDAPKPKPKDDQVLVQVCAAAITPTEFAWYPTFHTPEGGNRPFPVILGHEFSGVVEAMGPTCTGVQIGDLIYGLNDWFMDGAQAEYCLTVPANIAPKPATLDHTQAAVVPISALTAWQGLIERTQLSEGQRVLVHGAAGGVGSFAVQLARYKRAHVIATASAANTDFVKALGADEVIDYRTTPFETVVRDVDIVLDTVGGDTRHRSWEVLKKGGRLVTIAADTERSDQQRVRDAFFIVEPNREQLIEISRLIDTGIIRPIVGDVFSMDDVRQAYERKPVRGKNVLCVAER
ncbi:MAG TPA: NADP-dependent oxidoreductase [Nitrospiraceae bacterium]|nr:NADP-dependent oxidoreductase [Nitrospiraceae bacterium]